MVMTRGKLETPGRAAAILKQLRREAGISVRKLAAELKMATPTYGYYESRFKGDHLPFALYLAVREIFMARGVPEDRIDRLLPDYLNTKFAGIAQKLDRLLALEEERRAKEAETTQTGDNGHEKPISGAGGRKSSHKPRK